MKPNHVYTVIGIGIGPFNLGLAALLEPVNDVSSIFFDQQPSFNWHPGLMLNEATIQVPFLADLVTMASPTSPYSFLHYLKSTDRIYKFYIREQFYMLRKEYNCYCQWVAAQLPNCRFGQKVLSVNHADGLYEVKVQQMQSGKTDTYYAEKLVLGTGTVPALPELEVEPGCAGSIFHSAQYLFCKEELLKSRSVCIVGSGQSAAEIFYDLLPYTDEGLHVKWFTRSPRFFPMEYSRLALELTSPEYIDYFFGLESEQKKKLLRSQNSLYKGINSDLINSIYDTMYAMSVGNRPLNIDLRTNVALTKVANGYGNGNELHFTQIETNKQGTVCSDHIILATGYQYKEPAFLRGIDSLINRLHNGNLDVARNYTIDRNCRDIFVQNAELHTHGFTAPDLGMGAYRNSIIINQLAGREIYAAEKRIAFQEFDLPVNKEVLFT